MFPSLSIGASALLAAQRGLETTSHNVANATNTAYTRQRTEIVASQPTPGTPGMRGDGMRGTGVTVVAINRMRNQLADVSWRSEAASAGSAAARSTTLDRAQEILGPFTAGAPDALSKFWSSWDQLALTPTSPAARAGVINAGQQLATSLNDASRGLDEITADVNLKVNGDVSEVNNLIGLVAKLNGAILDATTAASAPNDLMDSRDAALDKLSTLVGATSRTNDNGMVDVYVGGTAIVRGTTTETLSAAQVGGLPTVKYADGRTAAVGGELGGYISVSNQTIPSLRADLDGIAQGLRDLINDAHTSHYDLNGVGGEAFFTGNGAADLAVSSTMTADKVAASASGSPNDGNGALSTAGLRSTIGVGSSTVGDALAALAGRLGAEAASAAQQSTASQTSMTGLTSSRAALDGVNIDEEMVDLLKYQHMYESAARVISISDDMLDTLINRMGVG